MKIHVYPWYEEERNALCLRWGVYQEGLIADCVREDSAVRRLSGARTRN